MEKYVIDIKEVLTDWAEDSKLSMQLDEDSRNTPLLHAKYLEKLANAKLLLKRSEFSQKTLLKQKWEWYNGKMDEDRINELGWSHDPFDGLKIMKNDMSVFYNSDKDLQTLKAKIDYLKITVDFLKECMQNITWRHQTIKNTIDWRKFMAGQ